MQPVRSVISLFGVSRYLWNSNREIRFGSNWRVNRYSLGINQGGSPVALLTVVAFLYGGSVNAQQTFTLPLPSVSDDPTRLQQPLHTPAEPPKEKPSGFKLPPIPEAKDLSEEGTSISIKQIEFTGNRAVSTEELHKIAAPYLNQVLKSQDLEDLRQRVTLKYVDQGYINSGAVIPNQSVAGGILRIHIVEGKLTEVLQRGQGRLRKEYIRDRLMLQAGDPLNADKLSDSYRILLNDPLIDRLNGRLIPGAKPGEAILDVNVTRARPYQFYGIADDYATPAVGTYAGRVGGWISNLTTFGERISAELIASGGFIGYSTGINVPLNAYDTRFEFIYSDTYNQIIEAPFDILDIKTNITGYDASITHPVYRSPTDQLLLGLNFVVRQDDTTIFGGISLPTVEGLSSGMSQVSVLRISQRAQHREDDFAILFWSTFSVGLDVLGATIQNNERLPDSEFFSWLAQSIFTYNILDNGAHIVLKANIQLADDPLLPLERYALGGVYTVRGYRENTYVRDNAFNTSIEFRYPIWGDPGGADYLFIVPFMDYGGAWNNPTLADSNTSKNYLHSVGIGLNAKFDRVSGEFYWAHAIAKVPGQSQRDHSIQDDGIHFRVVINAF